MFMHFIPVMKVEEQELKELNFNACLEAYILKRWNWFSEVLLFEVLIVYQLVFDIWA